MMKAFEKVGDSTYIHIYIYIYAVIYAVIYIYIYIYIYKCGGIVYFGIKCSMLW